MHLAAGLSVGLTGLAAGYAIGIVGDMVFSMTIRCCGRSDSRTGRTVVYAAVPDIRWYGPDINIWRGTRIIWVCLAL